MRVSAKVCTDLSRSIKRNWSASAAAIVSILQLPDFCWRWSPCYHLILHHRTTKLFWCLDVCCSSCHHESLTQLEAQGGGAERVEVSVPALDEDSGHGIHARRYLCWFFWLWFCFFFFLLLAWSLALKRSLGDELMINILWWDCGTAGGKNQQKKTWVWKRVLVSATGECTPVNEDGDSIDGDEDLQDESVVGGAEVTRQRRRQERKLSLPRMSFGKLTESFEDKVVDAFLWLLKQTQGKQIHATKVPTYSRISSFSMPPDSWDSHDPHRSSLGISRSYDHLTS